MVENESGEDRAMVPPTQEEEEAYQNEQARLLDLAEAVLQTELGRGEARKQMLGDDYDAVMSIVRDIRNGTFQNGTKE